MALKETAGQDPKSTCFKSKTFSPTSYNEIITCPRWDFVGPGRVSRLTREVKCPQRPLPGPLHPPPAPPPPSVAENELLWAFLAEATFLSYQRPAGVSPRGEGNVTVSGDHLVAVLVTQLCGSVKRIRRQSVNRAWLRSTKTLFTKTGDRLDCSEGCGLSTPAQCYQCSTGCVLTALFTLFY